MTDRRPDAGRPRRVERRPPPEPSLGAAREAATRRARGGRDTADRLRRSLSSPGAARQAFLLREVLGPPVSLRTGPHDRPD